ncbi:matrixin family metalloprotease [Candidatus Nitrosocosmicus sp. T]
MHNSIKLLLLSFMTMVLFTTISIANPSFARDHDDDDDDDDDDNNFSDKDVVQICCAWGYELADGLLTYSIDTDDDDDDLKDAVSNAMDSWNEGLTGITLVETDDNEDIKISFKNDGERIAGKTVNYLDQFGFIRQSHITVSEESYDRDFSSSQIEQITLHELGHVLGLDHANFRGNLMAERVDIGSTTISSCEIEGVHIANAWKVNNGDTMYLPKQNYIEC